MFSISAQSGQTVLGEGSQNVVVHQRGNTLEIGKVRGERGQQLNQS